MSGFLALGIEIRRLHYQSHLSVRAIARRLCVNRILVRSLLRAPQVLRGSKGDIEHPFAYAHGSHARRGGG